MPIWLEQSLATDDLRDREAWVAKISTVGEAIRPLRAFTLVFALLLGSAAAASATEYLETEVTANDAAAGDWFGYAVAISRNTIIVGAPFDDDAGAWSGGAYIFERTAAGSGSWEQVKKLVASDAAAGDEFGFSVTTSGNTVVVGAPDDGDSGASSGAAYVFERDVGGSNNWGQVKKITASDAATGDRFGYAVAISSNTIIVGARLDDDAGESSGGAYIFEREAGGSNNWGQVKKLAASDATEGDEFGFSVTIERDTIVVGAPFRSGSAGSAYVFERNFEGAENWGQVTRLGAGDADAGDQFGFSVSVSAATAVVGARYSTVTVEVDDNYWEEPVKVRLDNAGSVYFFDRDLGGAENWGQRKKRTAFNARAGDQFGFAVSNLESRAIVGSRIAGDRRSGGAYVFERDRGARNRWGFVKRLDASNQARWDQYGFDVAVSSNAVVVGAPNTDSECPSDQDCDSGSIYIYTLAQTKNQQRCVNALNLNLSKVSAAHAKAILKCGKGYAKSGSSAEACLMESNRTIERAEQRTLRDDGKRCTDSPPDFGSTDAATVNDAAERETTDMIRDIYGVDLDAALITWADDKVAAKCQEAAMKFTGQCQKAKLKAFNRCKKTGLRKDIVRDSADLETCIGDDPRGSIARRCDPVIGKLATRVLPRSCVAKGVDLLSSFPGCATNDAEDLAACVDEIVECRVCRALNQADDLAANCDFIDDGEANKSCL